MTNIPGLIPDSKAAGSSAVYYGLSEHAWDEFEELLRGLIIENQLRSVCDIGGGANPVLDRKFLEEGGIDYCLLDISASELAKAPDFYRKLEADITAPDFDPGQSFDLAVSKMLAEHVKDAAGFHTNVYQLLNPGGYAVHFFPTLYALPFLVNWLIPEALAAKILNFVSPRDQYQHAKFPAYYHWCLGPTGKQLQRFRQIGYQVAAYWGFFGHSSYFTRFPPLLKLHQARNRFLVTHPRPLLTSFSILVLQKPTHQELIT